MAVKHWTRTICILLALCMSFQCLTLSAAAQEMDAAAETLCAQPEETAVAEESTQPEETAEPEESAQPEETAEPEESAQPEETAVPEGPSEQEASAAPVETAVQEKPAGPEVPAEPEEPTEPEEPEEPALPEYLQIPLYFQTDYPQTMYGSGSISTSGCSITCLAMVATYLTGHEYFPDELARYFGGRAENNIKRLEYGSEAMQLPLYKAENWHRTLEALQAGKIAIALMRKESIFTDTQHFIVLTGITEDGLIMVNDPYEPNYDVWNLKKGLRYGFTEEDILKGYDGAWIYDKNAMPEVPFLYSEPEIDKSNCRYPDIRLTLEETKLLARLVWAEARGESAEGQQAVAEVVFNRMKSDGYPNTLNGVIYAAGQFRTLEVLEDAEPYQMQYDAIERALYGPYVLPEEVVHFATFKTNEYVWGKIGGHIFCYEWNYEE